MNEFTPMSGVPLAVYEQLLHDKPFPGVTYSNMLLSGDDVTDAYDSDHLSEPYRTSMYFPGGFVDDGIERNFITLLHANSEDNERIDSQLIQESRESLLGLAVGATALGRLPKQHIDTIVSMRHLSMMRGSNILKDHQAVLGRLALPIAVVSYRKVAVSEVIEQGSSIACLYYPAALHPKIALRQIQAAVRNIQKQETL